MEIHAAIELERELGRSHGTDSPYFFIIGAGVSAPSIPLAAEIEQECRRRLAKWGKKAPSESDSPIQRYAECLEAAFQQPEHRRVFLHQQVHGKTISRATFRLAHLLGSGKLSRLVVTPNFDEMLERALRLFGSDVITCDHPRTALRINPAQTEAIQLVHVHGTHWFYDCRNLRGEMAKVAKPGDGVDAGMLDLLRQILHDRTPLVVGYSGWEGDVLMTALQRRLESETAYNLYWFCYTATEADRLPRGLVEHSNVRIVAPAPALPLERHSGPCEDHSKPLPDLAMVTGQPKAPRLSATAVFEAMNRTFEVGLPSLTSDPLAFFADQLEKSLAEGVGSREEGDQDIYSVRDVISRVRKGAELERVEREKATEQQKGALAALDSIKDALRRSEYSEAVTVAKTIHLGCLQSTQRVDLESALAKVYESVVESDWAVALVACEIRIQLAELALDEGYEKGEWLRRLAEAVRNRGVAHVRKGDPDKALGDFTRVADHLPGAPPDQVAKALRNRGLTYGEKGDTDKALADYTRLIEQLPDAPVDQVAKALLVRGVAYGEGDDTDKALADYTRLIEQLPGVSVDEVANALILRAAAYR